MAVNLEKNKQSLLDAWNDVVSDKTATNWVLLGYEKQTFDLKVVGKGDDGLEEMTEDLNSGKIMYAFCKVTDPNTSLPKLVLINWQGEAAPLDKKGKCANHLRDISTIFKGAHVTINARTEDDVEASLVMSKVAKSTASSFNFNVRKAPEKPPKPVGSVYKRTVASTEINASERDKFWEKEEAEEKKRIEAQRSEQEKERQKLEEERKRRELEEAKARDERSKERGRTISEIREAEKKSNPAEDEKRRWEQQQAVDRQYEEERRMRRESLKNERKAEAEALIAQRTINARAVFEQNSSAGQLNNRPRSHSLQYNQLTSTPTTNKPVVNTTVPTVTVPTAKTPPIVTNDTNNAEVVQRQLPIPDVIPSAPPESRIEPPKVENVQPAVAELVQQPKTLLKEGLPRRQVDSDQDENDDDEWETPVPQTQKPQSPPATIQSSTLTPSPTQAPPAPAEEPAPPTAATVPTTTTVPPPAAAPATVTASNGTEPAAAAEDGLTEEERLEREKLEQQYQLYEQLVVSQGMKARALYDYQAADDTEISFDPDDVITHIEQIDEGWWQGMAPDGTYGLFPANYVELLED